MNPADEARRIANQHLAEGTAAQREALAEAIRWAIVQGQIEARHPPELGWQAPGITDQIVCFVNDYLLRMRGASYAKVANRLRECKARVLELERTAKPKPVALAKTGAGD